ncbi:right-handed parallel beta-helix repeat-containing protein [Flammeovirga pectinis]|uniref:Right-handed parallel beta-helix repeat-containing protein n=1 Tax=Flammeovirga pectinis TaxID=2494373 RepID=A0A3Q9FN43_9BACT|nr:right-handed parallel beta-helix repeat-containing protein [Flammeovirga pectinis]AZQ63951.1 right-handed parallel beta-helix repeat-containing protein [Flammeovirga pectinis]
MNRLHKIAINLVFLLTTCIAFAQEKIIIKNTDDITQDATAYVLNKVQNANSIKGSHFFFEKGVYHFYPDKGLEKFCYISNHKDVFVKTAFPLIGKKNIVINGGGSTFIFHGKMIPFLVEDGNNIKIKNVEIDWATSFHSEGKVIDKDLKEHTFDVKFSEEYPYEIRNEQVYFIKEYYEHNLGQTILFDEKRRAVAFNTEISTPISTKQKGTVQYQIESINYKYTQDRKDLTLRKIGLKDRIKVKEIKPGVLRFYNHKKALPPIGSILTTKGAQGENRVAPALRIKNTDSFLCQNVTIFNAGGMGLIAENSSNITLTNLVITPSKGKVVSTTADATHFVGCRGKIEIRNSFFENQLDDAVNIHGTYQEVVNVEGKHTLGIRMGHHQQEGFIIGKENDTIGLVRLDDSFSPYQTLTIATIKVINSRYQLITFKEEIPAVIKSGDLIENLSAYPEVVIEKNTFRGNRARGLLLSTPKKTLVKDNYFHTEMEAILIPVESGKWFESGSQSNLTIVGNIFEDCNHGGHSRGLIRLVTDDDNQNYAFSNITIENNIFKSFDNLILEIANTDGLKFIGNTILKTETFPMLYPDNPAFRIKSSRDIIFHNNDYKGNASQIIQKDVTIGELSFQ